jgi:AcrR family transcriptional regulator
MAMGARPTRPGRRRDTRLDAAILDAALALFVEGGVVAASFEAIAARTGASRSTIYRRWPNRDELLLAAIDRLRTQLEAGAEDWAARPVAEVIELFQRLTLAAATDAHSIGLLRQVLALDPHSPIKHRYWAAVIQPRRDTFAQMITIARQRGELPAGLDPYLLQDLLAGALAFRLLMHPDKLDETQAQSYLRELLTALGLHTQAPHTRVLQ